jgi:hypothetical protein
MVRYYGYYSNLSRRLRQKGNQDILIPLQTMEILYELPHLTWCDVLISNKRQSGVAQRKNMKIFNALKAILD